jgi:acetyl esterase
MIQPAIHPDMNELLAAKAAKPQGFDPAQQRVGHDTYGAALQRPYPDGMIVANREIVCHGQGRNDCIALRTYHPRGVGENAPCVIYLHGGGFVIGSLDSGDGVAWGIADEVGAVVVSVDYRLAPEFPFPAAVEDCHAAVSYVASHADEFGIDPARLAIWGDSAGGNLCVATCMIARDRGGPSIVAHAAVYPVLTAPGLLPSHTKHAESAGLTSSFMEAAWESYVGANGDGDEPYAAPLKSADLSAMPPAHIHIAEIDPLADDGREYVRRLLEAGVDAELHCARRMIHGFARARHSGPDAGAEFAAICRSLRGHLNI